MKSLKSGRGLMSGVWSSCGTRNERIGGREGVVLAHELGLRVARRVHEHVVGVEHQGELVAREEVRRGQCALW